MADIVNYFGIVILKVAKGRLSRRFGGTQEIQLERASKC